MNTDTRRRGTAAWLLPLAGIAYAVLSAAGDLTIGKFPSGDTAPAKLVTYYHADHAHVALGGQLYTASTLFFLLFGVALYVRVRAATATAVSAVVLVAVAVETAGQAFGAGVYSVLGEVGAKAGLAPDSLQALHVFGSEAGTDAGLAVLLLAVALAGIVHRAFPRWLAWSALVIGVAVFTPIGFLASLVFLLWTIAAGITLAISAAQPAAVHAQAPTLATPASTL
ncbi:MAG: hypothetical protein M3070_17040 [Actinomycetota bacterium]|nr:hypothetical protein [Actinomycetota bacterium]